mmetsp:Transcript_36620/g.103393  ORF Transcript_36620/g.103393 Transcript_36620/m.103393 type:complete len:204 (+) Transcript_36620:884-1495(+)
MQRRLEDLVDRDAPYSGLSVITDFLDCNAWGCLGVDAFLVYERSILHYRNSIVHPIPGGDAIKAALIRDSLDAHDMAGGAVYLRFVEPLGAASVGVDPRGSGQQLGGWDAGELYVHLERLVFLRQHCGAERGVCPWEVVRPAEHHWAGVADAAWLKVRARLAKGAVNALLVALIAVPPAALVLREAGKLRHLWWNGIQRVDRA